MRGMPSAPKTMIVQSIVLGAVFSTLTWVDPSLRAQSSQPAVASLATIDENELKTWLTYLASDELQGRQTFTEGYGLAAQYVAAQLKAFGVKPLGPNGSYLQPVRLRGYRVTRNSSITIESGDKKQTFKHGDHVTFPANAGGKQAKRFDGVEFLGSAGPDDLKGRDLKGKLAVIVPNTGPPQTGAAGPGAAPPPGPRGAAGAIAQGAAAVVVFSATPAAPNAAEQALTQAQAALAQASAAVAEAQRGLRAGGAGRGAAPPAARGGVAATPTGPEFTTVQRVDNLMTPQVSGDETLFEALFAGSATTFADLRAKSAKGEPMTPQSLPARVNIEIDQTYEAVSQQTTHNVVGLIEGTDRRLKETVVLFSAHLDHVGASQTGGGRGGGTDVCRRRSPAAQAAVTAAGKTVQRPSGRAAGRGGAAEGAGRGTGAAPAPTPFDQRDLISNGADDDGSGSTALLAIAKAFATGPKPKRSIVVAWHAGEEGNLLGSRFNTDFPAVPLDKIEAVLNMDMIGRDDCNNIEGDFSNTLFIVGADRISTELHNLIVSTNRSLAKPMTLDYELNDAADPEGVYSRSDHYSYASKGIPVAFFTTGLHPDYHRVSDSVDKIRFDKLARVTQLVYQSGFALANGEKALTRDNKGPRTGFGSPAEMLK